MAASKSKLKANKYEVMGAWFFHKHWPAPGLTIDFAKFYRGLSRRQRNDAIEAVEDVTAAPRGPRQYPMAAPPRTKGPR